MRGARARPTAKGWCLVSLLGLLGCLLGGCGEPPEDAGAGQASIAARAPEVSARIKGPARLWPPAIRLEVRPVAAELGEDGRGARIAATAPAAIDLIGDGWPGRALDPVLAIGDLRFRHYLHLSPTVLRFVVADRTTLPDGAEVSLQYGADETTRVVVAPSLEPR